MENTKKYCQHCKYHRSKPATCTKKHIFMARKMLVCEQFKKAKK